MFSAIFFSNGVESAASNAEKNEFQFVAILSAVALLSFVCWWRLRDPEQLMEHTTTQEESLTM